MIIGGLDEVEVVWSLGLTAWNKNHRAYSIQSIAGLHSEELRTGGWLYRH